MMFQMRLKEQKHMHIFHYLIKSIARDSLVVAGHGGDTSLVPPNSTPLTLQVIKSLVCTNPGF